MRKAMGRAAPSINTREHYESNRIGQDPAKRYRWDLSYAAGLSGWIADNIYSYADDTHLDTAFKAIVEELGL